MSTIKKEQLNVITQPKVNFVLSILIQSVTRLTRGTGRIRRWSGGDKELLCGAERGKQDDKINKVNTTCRNKSIVCGNTGSGLNCYCK